MIPSDELLSARALIRRSLNQRELQDLIVVHDPLQLPRRSREEAEALCQEPLIAQLPRTVELTLLHWQVRMRNKSMIVVPLDLYLLQLLLLRK